MSLGIHFILEGFSGTNLIDTENRFSILKLMEHFVSDKVHGVILVVTKALMLGYLKGKIVLSKSVDRQINRISTLPNPASLKQIYSKGYYLLIAGMILLGISLRFLPITVDTRGAIDLCIGSALINGAMLYFRVLSQQLYTEKNKNLL
jgi:hypothetical protein